MITYVILTLELHDALQEKRNAFDAEMAARHWVKREASYTVRWFSPDAAVTGTQRDIHAAMAKAGITAWEAVCVLSTHAAMCIRVSAFPAARHRRAGQSGHLDDGMEPE